MNPRIALWLALGVVLWLVYTAWMTDYHPRPAEAPPQTSSTPAPRKTAPGSVDDTVPGLPAETKPAQPSAGQAPTNAENAPASAPAEGTSPVVRVLTDVLDMDIRLQGGELVRADLLKYPKHKDQPELVRLFSTDPAQPFVFQSGLTAGKAEGQPDHRAPFESRAREYRLAEGQDRISVPLTWTSNGVTVTKTFTFERGSYRIGLDYDVDNRSAEALRVSSYMQFVREQPDVKRSMFDPETYAFAGAAVYDGQRYRKFKLSDEEDRQYKATVTNGWVAAMQHHFVAAAVPATQEAYEFSLHVDGHRYRLAAVGRPQEIAAGARQTLHETLFVGPKLQEQLDQTHPELDRTADYGKLYFLAKPLFTVLNWVHRGVGNWGWAIVIVTALLKLAFYPLSEASGRSMAKMRALAPRIKNIQELYKDDREQLGRKMMELYKREKINPLAGCLPIVVQIPVFLAFYWVLLETVEMRQAPFMLWINDLSSRDPFFVLPILMGAAMFGQYRLNPAPPDPVQAKVFMFMPVVMTIMFMWFPSGLVLYWLTNTVLSIAQQWRINRVVAAKDKKDRTS
jgi:YidC/Oxa1 family membrane protein insertase